MGKKADARAARQHEKFAKFEAAKPRILAAVQLDDGPKIQHLPNDERLRIAVGVQPQDLEIPFQPRLGKHGGGILDQLATWCIRRGDVVGTWSWGEGRSWSDEEWAQDIEPSLTNFQKLTWGELHRQGSDTGHQMHHEHELHTVAAEAQARWLELGLEQFDTLFRFRLGNTKRFWGFRIGAHFFGVWWERNHRIYETKAR